MISLEKIPEGELKKSYVNLDKTLVNLSKEKDFNINAHTARVAVALDYSGSMSEEYRTGKVQKVLERLCPLALRFDDNGELDVKLFENGYKNFPALTLENYSNYVEDIIFSSRYSMGGTEYAPVLRSLVEDYKKPTGLNSLFKKGSSDPAFVIFITDGDNSDHMATDKIIRESAKHNIFVQFVGLGSSSFPYLEKLDDLDGRECDNTGFIKVKDFNKLSDEELYHKLLEQYVDWVKVKGL